jgi:hypothetical protein
MVLTCLADTPIRNKKKSKSKRADVATAGLVSDWQSKLSAAAPPPRQTSSKVKVNDKAPVEIASPLGGLEDEDALADIPGTLALSKGRPTASGKNSVRYFHV